jgi:preprotein translocase subunit SecA
MAGLFSSLFGGNKSEKDVKKITPYVAEINQHFASYQSITNDELRGKTQVFRQRIKDHLQEIDTEIAGKTKQADELPYNDLLGKDAIYQEVDKLKKERDKKIEEILLEILPEAFAVVKETARRFKENKEIISTATQLDRDLSVEKEYIRIENDQSIYKNSLDSRWHRNYLEHGTL